MDKKTKKAIVTRYTLTREDIERAIRRAVYSRYGAALSNSRVEFQCSTNDPVIMAPVQGIVAIVTETKDEDEDFEDEDEDEDEDL